MDFGALVNRAIRAAKLEAALYEEVEADTTLNREALWVVVIAGLASGIGQLLAPPAVVLGAAEPVTAGSRIVAFLFGLLALVIGYYIWAYITYYVGTKIFDGTADPGEMLRTLGYAHAPRVLGLLVFLPAVGGLLAGIGGLWALVAGIVAVRQALDFSTGKAIATVIVGWIVVMVLGFLVAAVFGVTAFAGAAALGTAGA